MKEDRCFSKTSERAVINFWTVMGESGGGVGELMESRGVGGTNAITGKASFEASNSVEDARVAFDFVDQLAVRPRASPDWSLGPSAQEVYDPLESVSDLLVSIWFVQSGARVPGRPSDSLASIRP
jgi:hypothetical protein